MNRLLVATIALSMLGAPLAFAQSDTAAPAPQPGGQAGAYGQANAGQPAAPATAPTAQGQANAPYPYGARTYSGGEGQQAGSASGYRGDENAGSADRGGGYSREGYRYHHHRVCRWRHHRRVCYRR